MDWSSLWQNSNQRGMKALENNQPEQAAELFNNPEWQAAAHYRAGQYEQAIQALEDIDHTEALYNKGNALAKLGRIPEAIEAYNKVLENNPEHEDAQHNRDLLQQQQQQSSDSQQDQNQQQSESQQQNQQQQSANSEQQNQQQSQQQENQQQSSESEQSQAEQQQAREQAAEDLKKEQEQQTKNQQQKKADEQTEEQQAAQLSEEDKEPNAEQQAMEQWLRRIPDDPGGLLRRKFMYQYRQQQSDKEQKQW
jgi:Ca-activated chloride channel family protein